jgi:DeoR family glycerol-3-phosphate regulon repressor
VILSIQKVHHTSVAAICIGNSMSFSHPRHKRILKMLESEGEIRTRDLMQLFDISEETARRDIKMFERSGRVVRVHGGAVVNEELKLATLNSRSATQAAEKEKIAAVAANLLKPGQNIFLGGGSTVFALARKIASLPHLRIVTNMIDTCIAASQGEKHQVVLLGGNFNPNHRSVTGPIGLRMIQDQFFDVAVIGVNAVDPQNGFYDHEEIGQALTATLVTQSASIVVLADHTKIGARARFRMLPLSAMTVLVTDKEPSASDLAEFASRGVRVLWE